MENIVEVLGQPLLQDHNLLKRELSQRLGTFIFALGLGLSTQSLFVHYREAWLQMHF